MKPLFATPMYGGVCHASYLFAMRDVWAGLDGAGIEHGLYVPEDSLIARARNDCVFQFMQVRKTEGFTHLFFIDADIGGFTADDVSIMTQVDLPIVVGAYRLKDPTPPAKFCLNMHTPLTIKGDGHGRHFVRVKDAGTGFMCINGDVLETLIARHPERAYWLDVDTCKHDLFGTGVDPYPTDPAKPNYLSEDYFFCALAARAGFGTWLYVEGGPLTHTGKKVFDGSISDLLPIRGV